MSYTYYDIKARQQTLIELVRANACMYNPKHKDYKNKMIKGNMWEEFAARINVDVTKAREMWRALRDGYIRYKKAVKCGKNCKAYSWSEQLAFLDPVLESKDSDAPQDASQQEVYISEDAYAKINFGSPEEQQDCWIDCEASSSMVDYNSQPSTSTYRQPETPESSKKRTADSMDKIIDYFQNKKKKENDAVDLLFMSYAKTFKSLPPKKQAILRVTLAKVFAEVEFGDIDEDSLNG